MIKSLNEKKFDQVEQLFRSKEAPQTADYSTLMWAKLKSNKPKEVLALMNEMQSKGIARDSNVYNAVMAAEVASGASVEQLTKVWQQMVDADKIQPHHYALNIVFEQIAARVRKDRRARVSQSLFDFWNKYGATSKVQPNERTWGIMLDACVEDGSRTMGWQLVTEMEKLGQTPTVGQLLSLIELALKLSSTRLARKALERLQSMGGLLNEGTQMHLALLWAMRGADSELLGMEGELRKRFPESQPSEAFYRLLLHGLTGKRTKVTGEKAFDKEEDEDEHNVDVDPGWSEVSWTDVFQTLHKMSERGYAIDNAGIERRLTGSMRSTESVDAAFYALEDLHRSGSGGFKCRISYLNFILKGCARVMDLDRAFATFAEIPKFGLQPNLASYNELLSACAACRDPDATVHVVRQMQAAQLELNDSCRRYVAQALASPQFFEKAIEILNGNFAGIAPEIGHSFAFMYGRSGQVEKADALVDAWKKFDPKFRVSQALRDLLEKEKTAKAPRVAETKT